jgi:tRNA-uridine 2-sulfurtransferase
MPQRVVLAMSGGVDSSVAAHLLRAQGHEVIGLFMRSGVHEETACATSGTASSAALPIVEPRSHKQGCCSASDAADARRVADQLDIPFHALNFEDAFGRIQDYFVDEYLAGRTPNPCVMCNNWLKFGRLWEFAQQVGATAIATGHYAQLESIAGERLPALTAGIDPSKDQSYVLFGLDRELLAHVMFPVGSSTKEEIRAVAHQVGLRVAAKPDSQEICFVPDHDYAGFIRRRKGPIDTAGELVDTAGRVLGNHSGYEQFTIGQRRGLGMAFGEPRYVVSVDAVTNRVVLGGREDLACHELLADRLNWLIDDVPETFECRAKIRYLHSAAPCRVERLGQDRVRVRFERPQSAVAPGQAVVFYWGPRVVGGGWILSSALAGGEAALARGA